MRPGETTLLDAIYETIRTNHYQGDGRGVERTHASRR